MERHGERGGARAAAVDGEHPGTDLDAAADPQTVTLARAIEAQDVAGLRSCVRATQELFPECEATLLEVAGGIAPYCGPGSSLSEAVGLGMKRPVTRDDVDRITEFYSARAVRPRAMCGPFADPSLARELQRAGYVPIERQSVLTADLARVRGRRDPRVVESGDPIEWAMSSGLGFKNGEMPDEVELRTPRAIAATPAIVLEARENGAIAITGAMYVTDGLAALFASSTIPAFRNRGWQTAFILDRLARARAAGARFARAGAAPGSTSERNFVRCGFTILGVRTLWEKPALPGKENDHA